MSADDDNEPFFQRWSRRKQRSRADGGAVAPDAAVVAAQVEPVALRSDDEPRAATTQTSKEPARQKSQPGSPRETPRALTEADFADVNFDALDYGSDYGRFMQAGVPESIRQKALTKLWMSDASFTQVDPFQDYAGDYTDAAMALKGAVKTAYKVGQGFLSDDEAHAWDTLGRPPVSAEVAALPVLKPGFRVRPGTPADDATLVAVQTAAILGPGAAAYGREIAESWAHGLTASGYQTSFDAGEFFEVAIDDHNGKLVAFCGVLGHEVVCLFVQPGFGRKGLASALLARAETAMRGHGFEHAQVVSTIVARSLYERHGYRVVADQVLPTRGGLDLPVFEMRKWLIDTDTVAIDAETPDQPDVAAFFAASEAYMGALYPAESNHFAPVATLLQPTVLFLVARVAGTAIGCGAIMKAADGTAEVKRMWVAPPARGLKLGVKILDALEAAARDDGVTALRLETGMSQPEAISLYRRAGFVEIAPFGDYQADPLSLFMEKRLTT